MPPAERAKIEAEKKAEEEKRTVQQAFWEIYVAPGELGNWLFGRRLVRGP